MLIKFLPAETVKVNTAVSPSSPLLEKLPRELRDEIYREVLTSPRDIIISNKHKREQSNKVKVEDTLDTLSLTDGKRSGSLTALLGVCHQIRIEATPILFSSNTFRAIIEDGVDLVSHITWLHDITYGNMKLFTGLVVEIRLTSVAIANIERATSRIMAPSRYNIVDIPVIPSVERKFLLELVRPESWRDLRTALGKTSSRALTKLVYVTSAETEPRTRRMETQWVEEMNMCLAKRLAKG